MDPITIAALVSMVAGAGLQAYDAQRSAKRQSEAARQAQQRQLEARSQATQRVQQQAEQFDPTKRQAAQDAIQGQLTQQYQQAAQPQVTAQGVQVGTTLPQGAGSSSYTVAKAKETAKVTESMRQLAAIMGRLGAPGMQRQNEAVALGDTATDLGRIQNGAANIGEIDRIATQAAGQPDFITNLAAAGLNAYGMSGLMGAGLGGGASGAGAPTGPGPLGSGTWFPVQKAALKGATVGGPLGSGTWLAPGSPF